MGSLCMTNMPSQFLFRFIVLLSASWFFEFVLCSPSIENGKNRPDAVLFQNTSYFTDDNLCLELPDGVYPDYNQACRMFFICSGGLKAATFWCTKGFVFSYTSGHCEPPDRARCPDPNNPPVLNRVFQLHMNGKSADCQQGDGVYPDFSSGCSSFFYCKGGKKLSFQCPDSTKFDWRTKTCRHEKNVICETLSCTDKEDGIYIDSNSYCRRYFQCSSGNISEYVCPDGTIYNARQHRCTRSSTTRCHGLEAAQCTGLPDGYYPDFAADCKIFGLCMTGGLKTFNCPAGTLFDIRSLTCESDAYCPKPEIDKCLGKANGIHADFDSDCRDFYMCLDGLLTHQGSCPQGTILNQRKGNCQPSSLVVCTTVTDGDCDGLPDGVYPDYDTGCSAFYICLGQRRISTSYCSGTNLYDIASDRCLPSSFVVCRKKLSSSSPPRLFDSYNCENRLGMFPEFSSDCQRYATCAYGHKQYFSCQKGFSFDPQSNACVRGAVNCNAPFAVATFQCLPSDDGIYVGPNCSQWHECKNGIGFTNVCPLGLLYDVNFGKCIGSNVKCPTSFIVQKRLIRSTDILHLSSIEDDFVCESNKIGLYEDPVSCRNFHFCVDGKRSSYACPHNFLFQRSIHRCAWNENSESCKNNKVKLVNNQQNLFSCAYLEDGMYADFSSNCKRYFVCENGEAIPVYCPEKQKFNAVKMMCDREEYVSCTSHTQPARARTINRASMQSDDVYHVYRPDDLFTETYSYVTQSEDYTTKPPNLKTKIYYEYDTVSEDERIPSPTDLNAGLDRSKAPNSISSESINKRYHVTKYNPTLHEANNAMLNSLTTISYGERSKPSTDDDKVDKLAGKPPSQDLDEACRNEDTGFFPDYESGCRMFHICFRSIRKTYSCPSILLFNPETQKCDLPENVVCSRPQSVVESVFDCKSKINEFVPDFDSGCRYYIGCMDGLPYKFACPKGKIFSSETSICEYENTYKCQYPQQSNSTLFDSNNEENYKSPSYRHVHGIPGQFYFSCSDKKDGFYPDFTRHCHVFYRCVRGKKFSHYCKQGLLFNPESGICDFEENVNCSLVNRTILEN